MQRLNPFVELIVIAAAGALTAILIDFTVANDGSLLRSISQYLNIAANRISSAQIPLYVIAGVLALIGASSAFYLRPLTRKGAFACGFVAIATLAILVP